ncbi:5-(carboxyamino)imidazole ribonucleotide synthase [Ferroacidibacillus organovorans]|uniref:N5-carboxyaminoimidazole ribonucleotide synthase n=1 Tax=Ferroacidibacillus organovorans TaxID=1765683 RepID=A0A117SY73_9BACL|nr:5-(carboxyamino)imidazole ribonucleotide synthase [Ferroacidibacillus organovorans]KUO96468.1 hypothetical protein ATW55_01105 [Ferroacidibacillus organovorans]
MKKGEKPFVLGLLGDGQLAQMTALAARSLGMKTHVFASSRENPAAFVADEVTLGDLADEKALVAFAKSVDALTYDTENLPYETICQAAAHAPAYPDPNVLHIAQHRIRERTFLSSLGVPIPNVAYVTSEEQCQHAAHSFTFPGVLKTAAFGYDGKGQRVVREAGALRTAWRDLGEQPCVLEAFVDFEREMSVIVARAQTGEMQTFGVIDNEHRNHILHASVSPSSLPSSVKQEAQRIAQTIAASLDLVGLLAVEMFATTDGRVLVNELAPRPHNSGHVTQRANALSQFHKLCLAASGQALGEIDARPGVMINLLGDLFPKGTKPVYRHVGFLEPPLTVASGATISTYFYGKKEARNGRKMGHLIAVADTVEKAYEAAAHAYQMYVHAATAAGGVRV